MNSFLHIYNEWLNQELAKVYVVFELQRKHVIILLNILHSVMLRKKISYRFPVLIF